MVVRRSYFESFMANCRKVLCHANNTLFLLDPNEPMIYYHNMLYHYTENYIAKLNYLAHIYICTTFAIFKTKQAGCFINDLMIENE